MANFGEGYRYHITGLTHNQRGFPASQPQEIDWCIRHLHNKIKQNAKDILIYKQYFLDDAEIALIAYGSVARAAERVVRLAREQGIKVGMLKLITIWPFPEEELDRLANQVKLMLVPEMNLGQIVLEVERAVKGKCPVISHSRVDGELINPEEIWLKIQEENKK